MKQIYIIALKELKSYFFSPLAYVIMTVFALLSGYFFTGVVFHTRNANDFGVFISYLSSLLLLVIPLITMRSFAEENKSGTFELVLSYPLKSWQFVVGKFAGASLFSFIMILPTLFYISFLEMYSIPDYGIIVGGYAGIMLLSMCFISFGIFASSLTESQVVAGIASFGFLLLLWAIDFLFEYVNYTTGLILRALSIRNSFMFFARGIIDSRALVFFVSIIIFMLLLTVKIIEDKRYRS
ncbi:MAG: ABC transporter permease subunit [Candidatus Muiribacteriota bacterium]